MPQLPRTKHRTADRQAELVQAALQLAAQHSPAEVTTAALAQAIGITQGGVFKHFESKEAIWLAVLDWVQAALLQRLQDAAAPHVEQGDAQQALRAVFVAHVAFAQAHPGVPRLVFQELQHARPSPLKDKVQQLMQRYRQLLTGLLEPLRGPDGPAPGLDVPAATVLFIGAVQGLVMQSLISGTLSGMAAQAHAVYDLYEAGLRAKPSTVPRNSP